MHCYICKMVDVQRREESQEGAQLTCVLLQRVRGIAHLCSSSPPVNPAVDIFYPQGKECCFWRIAGSKDSHSLAEMNACKSNQCFPLCNLPLHDLVSHQAPHLSTQLKSAKLMSILIKLSVQCVRTVCKKTRVGLEKQYSMSLLWVFISFHVGKENFIPVGFTDWLWHQH